MQMTALTGNTLFSKTIVHFDSLELALRRSRESTKVGAQVSKLRISKWTLQFMHLHLS